MVMGVSDSLPRGNRGRLRPDARRKKVRSSRFRRIDLEGLESRTLLATIPAAAATALPANLSSLMGNAGGLTTSENSATVEVDPTNPSKIVALWIDNDPSLGITGPPYAVQSILEGVYTINAGQTWTPLFGEPGTGLPVNPILMDPNTDPTDPFPTRWLPTPLRHLTATRTFTFWIRTTISAVPAVPSLCKSSISRETRRPRLHSPHHKRVAMLPIEFSTSGCRPTTSRSIRRCR